MKSRPLFGAAVGVAFGLGLTVIAGLIVAADRSGRGLEDVYGITFPQLCGLYIVGGAIGGACFGMLLPLVRWPAGAAVVGALALTPLYLGAAALLGVPLLPTLLAPIVIGGTLGYRMRRKIDIED
jgi:hypothetical protein